MTATPDTAALKALLAKVEWGDDQAPFWKVWLPENEDGPLAFIAQRAYHGSLDAAKALMDAVLPGWIVVQMCQLMEVDAVCNYTGGIDGWLVEVSPIMGNVDEGSGTAQDPARAWLVAILRALLSAPVTPEKEGE